MPERITCCVPFCRRTIAAEKIAPHKEWVCSVHWAGVSRKLKAEYNLAKRRARRILRFKPIYAEYWKLPGGSPGRLSAVAMWRRLDAAWEKCKAGAIEREAGI